MKKILIIAALLLCAYSYVSAQDTEKLSAINKLMRGEIELSQKDSLFIEYIQSIERQTEPQRYKLYPTENLYNLIKLDTATGRLWLVQYGMNDKSDAMVAPIDNTDAFMVDGYYLRPGRFELYPTKNMYTFILLDTLWGYTYQVQWSTSPDKRFRQIIY